MKKYLNKVKIVKPCDSIISEIPILTVALFWSASYMTGSSQNRDLRYNRITRLHYLHLVYVLVSQSLFSLFRLTIFIILVHSEEGPGVLYCRIIFYYYYIYHDHWCGY